MNGTSIFPGDEVNGAFRHFELLDAQWCKTHSWETYRGVDLQAYWAMADDLREHRAGRSLIDLVQTLTKAFDVSPFQAIRIIAEVPEDEVVDAD